MKLPFAIAQTDAVDVGPVGAVQIANPPAALDVADFRMTPADRESSRTISRVPNRPARRIASDSQTLPLTSPLMPRRRIGCFMTFGLPAPLPPTESDPPRRVPVIDSSTSSPRQKSNDPYSLDNCSSPLTPEQKIQTVSLESSSKPRSQNRHKAAGANGHSEMRNLL